MKSKEKMLLVQDFVGDSMVTYAYQPAWMWVVLASPSEPGRHQSWTHVMGVRAIGFDSHCRLLQVCICLVCRDQKSESLTKRHPQACSEVQYGRQRRSLD